MNPQTNQADSMGPNMVHSYPNNTKGICSLDTGKPTKILGNWLHLSTLSNWRFINLNQSFEDALNLHPRPLEVTAKVTANRVTVTQSWVKCTMLLKEDSAMRLLPFKKPFKTYKTIIGMK